MVPPMVAGRFLRGNRNSRCDMAGGATRRGWKFCGRSPPRTRPCLPACRQAGKIRKDGAPGKSKRGRRGALRAREPCPACVPDAKMLGTRTISQPHTEVNSLSDSKQDESFKVVDRRPFTAEGELRPD